MLTPNPPHPFDLSVTRFIAAPRSLIWRAWTEPELLKRWFTPRPWTTPVVELDVRPGGSSRIVMRGPDGEEHDNLGVYLEVVKDQRLVFTDAFTGAWIPSAKPFMTGVVTLADEAGGTRYTAMARHWNAEDKTMHEQMGFHVGWNAATDQLEALVAELARQR
jgi:uncharacterized protein YndB with AHSA1/START domain